VLTCERRRGERVRARRKRQRRRKARTTLSATSTMDEGDESASRECSRAFDRPSPMRIEPGTEPDASVRIALRVDRHVVSRGVRHIPIDVLPRDVLTFGTICGQDVIEDERGAGDSVDCT